MRLVSGSLKNVPGRSDAVSSAPRASSVVVDGVLAVGGRCVGVGLGEPESRDEVVEQAVSASAQPSSVEVTLVV